MLLALSLLFVFLLLETFSDPPGPHYGEVSRKIFQAVVFFRAIVRIMQLCGISMHAIRVALIWGYRDQFYGWGCPMVDIHSARQL